MYRESETLEKKSSFAAWKEIVISLSAFANKKGGKVIVGLDDQGNPTGLSIGKDTLEEMANKIKMHTDPILYPSINVKTFGLGEIVELGISAWVWASAPKPPATRNGIIRWRRCARPS